MSQSPNTIAQRTQHTQQYTVEQTDHWDKKFFYTWLTLRDQCMGELQGYLPDSIKDLEKIFGVTSPFNKKNDWMAITIKRNNEAVCKGLISLPYDWHKPTFAPLGFFDSTNDPAAATALLQAAETWAQNRKITEIRGPINGNFFISYRICIENPAEPFYGEPICPQYYHSLFERMGFEMHKTWRSEYISVQAQKIESQSIIEKFLNAPEIQKQVKLRPLKMKEWNSELRLVHSMFMNSYSQMDSFMPVSWEEFQFFYNDIKHLLNPKLTHFVELDQQPVAFIIGYFDPQSIFETSYKLKAPTFIKKLYALFRLRTNRSRLLIPYVGKTSEANQVKGLMAKLVFEILNNLPQNTSEYIGCYIAESSASYKSLPKEQLKSHARYGLYRKKISC